MDLAFAPDGATLLSHGQDRAIRLWDLGTGAVRLFQALPNGYPNLALSPDGRFLVCCEYATVVVWDSAAPAKAVRLPTGRGIVRRAWFTPDGGTIVGVG